MAIINMESCRYCEQNFDSSAELDDHLELNHSEPPEEEIKEQSVPLFSTSSLPTYQPNQPQVGLGDYTIDDNVFCELDEEGLLERTQCRTLQEIKSLDLSQEEIDSFTSDLFPTSQLSSLEVLNLSANYLRYFNGVDDCHTLLELNISNNLLQDLEPVTRLQRLRILDASNNKLSDILPVEGLSNLLCLKLHQNKIIYLKETINVLRNLPRLRELSMNLNPCFDKDRKSFETIAICLNLFVLNEQSLAGFNEKIDSKEADRIRRLMEEKPVNIQTMMANAELINQVFPNMDMTVRSNTKRFGQGMNMTINYARGQGEEQKIQ